MTTTATDDRNADLIPDILKALRLHQRGEFVASDVVRTSIEYRLAERGFSPVSFWHDFDQCLAIANGRRF